MPAPKVHLLLVSAQAAPNLLPALDPLLRPDLAVLLVTQRMQAQADALQAVLTEAGVRCRQHPVPDEHKLAQLEDALLAAAADQEGADVAFKHTTKSNNPKVPLRPPACSPKIDTLFR